MRPTDATACISNIGGDLSTPLVALMRSWARLWNRLPIAERSLARAYASFRLLRYAIDAFLSA